MLFILLFSTTTISPFSTSLTNDAPTISKAHVSEAKINDSFNLPITNGLIPKGSLTPISFLLVIITREKPPFIWKRASINLSTIFSLLDFAISCTIVSVSLVVLKIAPSLTRVSLNAKALVKLPL